MQSVPQVPQTAQDTPGGKNTEVGSVFNARKLNTPLDKLTRNTAGRRSTTRTERKRGHYIMSRMVPMGEKVSDLAFDATLRAAAPFQRTRRARNEQTEDPKSKIHDRAFLIERPDIRKKVRVKRVSNLVVFVVDASWSMAVAERMAATKGAIMSLLTDAYQRRDRVGLIVFQKNMATLVLPPTGSVELAKTALSNIPVGGKTPLTAGLALAHRVITREKLAHPEILPLLIILTDGAGNVSMSHLPPMLEAHRMADMIAEEKIRSVVINMEHAAFDQGLAKKLADHLECACLSISDLRAESLYRVVKTAL
ncbi:MAG: VWA domain-containing protein [Chloroflexi bacterium]|nr:VWA domain-containing protein [Chloroflexota bacterium]